MRSRVRSPSDCLSPSIQAGAFDVIKDENSFNEDNISVQNTFDNLIVNAEAIITPTES